MKIDWSFPRQVFYAVLVIGGCGSYPLLKFYNADVIDACVAGSVIATVNVLLGFASIEYSIGKSMTTFFKIVLGGMGVRMALMLAALFGLVKAVEMNAAALIVSLGIFYMVYLTLEILYIQKKVTARQLAQ
jgi:hypothetical protein